MERPYDPKALVSKLKSRGLDLAEESAQIVAEEAFSWLKESAALSSTPYDDMALVVLPQIESLVFKAVDKIDGKEG